MPSVPLNVCEVAKNTLVLAIGAWNTAEFLIARKTLESGAELTLAQNCSTACELLAADGVSPDFIVLAQPLPGSIEQADIERLRRAAPLAQIIVVAGTWCEGEVRTGQPVCGVMRVYWYELLSWWPTRNRRGDWSGALDGPLSRRRAETTDTVLVFAKVAIRTQSFETFEALSSFLAPLNVHCTWFRGNSVLPGALTAGIWDGGQLDAEEFGKLIDFARTVQDRGGSVVVLLDFPRQEHFTRLQKIGGETVFGKPYNIEELAAAIAKLTGL